MCGSWLLPLLACFKHVERVVSLLYLYAGMSLSQGACTDKGQCCSGLRVHATKLAWLLPAALDTIHVKLVVLDLQVLQWTQAYLLPHMVSTLNCCGSTLWSCHAHLTACKPELEETTFSLKALFVMALLACPSD